MKAIWKFTLEVNDFQNVVMPIGAKILSIQTQKEKPCIWAVVNPKADTELRSFMTYGTGQDIKYSLTELEYVGTYQLHDGSFVAHVFEIIKK